MSTPYYQASGQVPSVAYPLAILFALAILPGAWAYAWLTIHVPFVVDAFIAFGFSLYLGWLVRRVAQAGHVRNPLWSSRAGVVFALLGWYCQWACWVALKTATAPLSFVEIRLLERILALLADPGAMAGFATKTFQNTTGLFDSVSLLVVWLLELGMHLLLPPLMGKMKSERPFCEVSKRWATKIPVAAKFSTVDPVGVVPLLEANPAQVRQLLLPLPDTEPERFARAVLYRCEASDSYLSLGNVVRTTNGQGNAREKEEPVCEFLRLSGIDPDELLRHWSAGAGADADHRKTTTAAAEEPVAPELDAALAHLHAERFDEALAGAVPATGSDQLTLRTDANRICALACSRLGRWPEALAYWQALDADEPTAHNALQLATTSVMAGELADGMRLVEEARDRNEQCGEMVPLTILTNFVTALTQTGHVREALPYVDAIRQAYLSVGTTDPTLLYASGMPAFSVFLEKSRPVVCAALDGQKAQRWYASMLPRLDEAGQAELNVWLGGGLAFPPTSGMPG